MGLRREDYGRLPDGRIVKVNYSGVEENYVRGDWFDWVAGIFTILILFPIFIVCEPAAFVVKKIARRIRPRVSDRIAHLTGVD
jgi:hypothetical protein